ncbi:MAG: peptidoglycan DD-metalloendopeptidase family protein [Myxococcaceae bacterium]
MRGPGDKPSAQLESLMLKQMLEASGAFHPTDAAGSKVVTGLFTEAMADAIAKAGGLGIAKMIDQSIAPHASAPEAAPHPGARVTSGFGSRIDPITHQASNHPGVDLGATLGTPIPAAEDGTVIQAGPRGGYGNAIEIAHPDGTHTLYGHASELLVKEGDQVRAGETIAKVGESGRATGPHLHLEVRKAGVAINPSGVLKAYRLGVEDPHGGSHEGQ